jgi:hypothetical protein
LNVRALMPTIDLLASLSPAAGADSRPIRRLPPSASRYDSAMSDDTNETLELRIPLANARERAALEQALLRARATELTEVRRRQVRLSAGYGDATTRDSMDDEAESAQLRWTMLDRLVAAVRGAGER